MHDDYPSPPSTPSSSRLMSIPSPLSCPIPHSIAHHASSYGQRRASKASDIAHLLDPSYSPTRANSSAYPSQIYVDHAGEAHDPDFRLFAPANYSPKRREFLTCESDDDDDADDADDADDEEAASFYYPHSPKRASFDSARSALHSHSRLYRPDSRASDPVYSRTPQDAAYAPFTYTYTFEEQGYVSDEPRRETNKLRRRRVSLEHDRSPVEEPEPVPEQPRNEQTNCNTASITFRRQWHALRLRTQVAAFHARKRVTRIVSPSKG